MLCALCVGAEAFRCESAEDCNYNGNCTKGSCTCAPGWRGDACDGLNLVPTKRSLGYQNSILGQNVTSWGGSVVKGDDGMYHMYAAEIYGYCGMNVWLSNSFVVHATSPDPSSVPFVKQGLVFDVFSHEPIAARAPTGEYVVYFTAVLAPNPLPVNGGQRCADCANGISPAVCGTDGNRNASVNLPTYMVYSKDPNGPWSDPVMVPTTDVFADSNFAPVIRPDGGLIALTRGAVMHASDWKNMSTYKVVGGWTDEGEDPFIWQDAAGIFHGIVHMGPRDQTYGMHYFSVDGTTWTASKNQGHAYDNVLTYTDGGSTALKCRERPHIVLDENKIPVGLTNGAAQVSCHDAGSDDHAFTSYQAIQP